MSKEIISKLFSVQDSEYKEFQSRLVPNISPDSMIGIRTPQMRKIAKEINGTQIAENFLSELPHKYYEENLIHFFLIAMVKDFNECINKLETFLPYIDCWPVCDQSSPKVFKKNHEQLLPYIKKWISSPHVYTARFGMRILMNEFLDEDFKEEYLELVASKKGDDYYLKMMIAWYFATALAKQYDSAISFIEHRKLEQWTHNKAIQKALESFRVSEEHKDYLRTLRWI
ncbi:MAG: DNA alkylation repair protein [Spirochaetales bacterium]|nr:DNA alkylation repair protein [Spirochaetales bacterium]